MRRLLRNVSEFFNNVVEFFRFIGMLFNFALRDRWTRPILIAFVIFETVYWTSPEWAQEFGHRTYAGDMAKIEARESALARQAEGMPISIGMLPEWRPIRIERCFESGFTVVSTLNPGPHGDFQYVVRDLATMPDGTIFRVVNGKIVRI